MEVKADRLCGEFCTALNYINTEFFYSSVLKLRYTQNSLGAKQMQYCFFALLSWPGGRWTSPYSGIGNRLECLRLVVDREIVFHCNIYGLDFGGDGKLDPLCEEARKTVLNA
uniref:Uncharacterized protein n=1 Tax=Ficedula albicollis TaxID=59894 RepID=A0A803WE57_FICAL